MFINRKQKIVLHCYFCFVSLFIPDSCQKIPIANFKLIKANGNQWPVISVLLMFPQPQLAETQSQSNVQ